MRPRSRSSLLMRWAPVSAGALLFGAITLVALSPAREGADTPDWGIGSGSAVPERVRTVRSTPKLDGACQLRFVSYNLENWLTMERGDAAAMLPKPEREKDALIKLLAAQQADVIGVQEIGTADDLGDLQRRLKQAGLDLPHRHLAEGGDRVRRLGLLSRFPIRPSTPAPQIDFRLEGRRQLMNRGILDVVIEVDGKPFRFIGVHFKSRREVAGLDQEEMRVLEAHTLRRHLDAVFKDHANARVVVYGDWNDTLRSAAVRTVLGNRGETGALEAVRLEDARGHAWTHHWRSEDVYSRIDYVALSRALASEVEESSSQVIDELGWDSASDHRPLRVVFRSP